MFGWLFRHLVLVVLMVGGVLAAVYWKDVAPRVGLAEYADAVDVAKMLPWVGSKEPEVAPARASAPASSPIPSPVPAPASEVVAPAMEMEAAPAPAPAPAQEPSPVPDSASGPATPAVDAAAPAAGPWPDAEEAEDKAQVEVASEAPSAQTAPTAPTAPTAHGASMAAGGMGQQAQAGHGPGAGYGPRYGSGPMPYGMPGGGRPPAPDQSATGVAASEGPQYPPVERTPEPMAFTSAPMETGAPGTRGYGPYPPMVGGGPDTPVMAGASFVPSSPVVPIPDALRAGWAEARQANWEGKADRAVEIYRRLIAEYPDNADLPGELGNVLFVQGNEKAAADMYFEAGQRVVRGPDPERVGALIGILNRMDPQKARTLREAMFQHRMQRPQ